jgi:hypothetical protein
LVLRLRSDAPIDATPQFVLEVSALPRTQLPPRPPFPPRVGHRVVPARYRPARAAGVRPRGPYPDPADHGRPPHDYQLFVRLTPPFGVTVTLVSPTGVRKVVTTEVR